MKLFSPWLPGALIVMPIAAVAQPMAKPMTASSPAASAYQSVFKDYVRPAPAAMSADKAWLEANRTVRDVDPMSMGSMPSMKPNETTVPATPPQDKASDAHAGHLKHGMGH
jgi:hypothetical protein